MSTCDTCIHFEVGGNFDPERKGFGKCWHVDEDGDDVPKDASIRAYSYDGTGFFQVGPKFGCIHHCPDTLRIPDTYPTAMIVAAAKEILN